MAVRTTPFRTGPRMLVFRKVEEILKADPGLQAVKVWSTWDGTGEDARELTPSMCPYLGLAPVALPNEVLAVGRTSAVLGVRITAAVAGLVAEDIVNFWDAIEDALGINRPFHEGTVYCTLQGCKAYSHRFVAPGVDAWANAQNPPDTFLRGTGMLVLRISRSA